MEDGGWDRDASEDLHCSHFPFASCWVLSSRAVRFNVFFPETSSAYTIGVLFSSRAVSGFPEGETGLHKALVCQTSAVYPVLTFLQAGSRDKPGQNADKAVVQALEPRLSLSHRCYETVRYLDPLLGAEASEPYAKDRDDLLQVLF